MGNSNQKYKDVGELKNASLEELQYGDYLKRYVAYGDTSKEALEKLILICKEHGIPEPKKIGNNYIFLNIRNV